MQYINNAMGIVLQFVEMGGPVLLLIGGLLFLMWSLIFERIFYFSSGLKTDVQVVINEWESRDERKSWNARQIRRALISDCVMKINQKVPPPYPPLSALSPEIHHRPST